MKKSNQESPTDQVIPSPERSANPFAEFDPSELRIDQSFLNRAAAKKLLTTIPVRKPKKQDFVRVHPDEKYRLPAFLIELEEDREVYLVKPGFSAQLGESDYFAATLYLCINRQKVVSFWPVKLPKPDGRQLNWHTSMQEAAEKAIKKWVKVAANMDLGAYEISEAEGVFPEPEWPEQSMSELLSIAFKGRIIGDSEHPVILKLRGLI
jgi:hypothetical protein